MKLGTPGIEIVISRDDIKQCLGSGELKPCPFCGCNAIGTGEKNRTTGNTVYTVICIALHKCGATVHACQRDAAQARREAIEHWNKRV